MQGTIDFRTFGTDRDSRRIAILRNKVLNDSDSYEAFLAPSNSVQLYTNCKYTDDFEQTIIVPYFDAWRTVDTVLLYPDGALPKGVTASTAITLSTFTGIYFIVNRRYSSLVNGAVEFDLMYNPVTSKIDSITSLIGDWERCQTLYTPWITQVPISDALKPSRYYNLTSTEQYTAQGLSGDNSRYIFWVQVTATVDINNNNASNLTVYGFPIIIPVGENLLTASNRQESMTYYGINIANGTNISNTSLASDYYRFPALGEFINDPTILGIQSSQITDISVSRLCPYYYKVGYFNVTSTGLSVNPAYNFFALIDGNGSRSYTVSNKNKYAYYNLSKETYSDDADYRQLTTTITLSDMEVQTGKVYIRDADGNYCLEIPTAWFDSNNQLKVVMQCHPDYGQMYYHIGIDTDTNIGIRKTINLPCSHLPYIGTEWNEYKAFSQSFDREQMYYSVAQTAVNTGIGLASGNSFAIGNALGTVGNIAGTVYSQGLKERRLQAQPARGYSLAYGTSYIRNLLEHPYAIVIETPANLTDAIYNNYIADYGYEVEGRATITLGAGYTRGTAFSSSAQGLTGEILNRLNDELRQGIRTVVIG